MGVLPLFLLKDREGKAAEVRCSACNLQHACVLYTQPMCKFSMLLYPVPVLLHKSASVPKRRQDASHGLGHAWIGVIRIAEQHGN